VVILYDVTASFTHWGMYNIASHVDTLPMNAGVSGSAYGTEVINDFGNAQYDGPCPARGCRAIRAPIGVHGVCAGYTVNVVDAGKFSCQCGDALSRLDRRRTETSDSGKRELDGILFIDPVYAMTRRYECFSGACPKTGTKAARCVQCAAGALPAGLKLRIIKSNGIAASVSQAITRKQSMKESRSTWCCNWRYTYPAAAVVASGSE